MDLRGKKSRSNASKSRSNTPKSRSNTPKTKSNRFRNPSKPPFNADFGVFWAILPIHRQFTRGPSGGPPGLGRKLAEGTARGPGPPAVIPRCPRGRPAGDPDGEFLVRGDVACRLSDGLVVDPSPVVHQKRGRKLASPGGRLCLTVTKGAEELDWQL